MPHKLWKISARFAKRCGVQLRKTHGGLHQPPLTGRGLNNAAPPSKAPLTGVPYHFYIRGYARGETAL